MTHIPEIKIDGLGRVSVAPDGMRLTLSLAALAPNYLRALTVLNDRSEALQTALRGAGVGQTAETTSYGISAQWENEYDTDKRKFLGHRAVHTLEVTIPFDSALLGRVVTRLAAGDAKPGLRTQFVLLDRAAHVRRARQLAMESARAAAQELATAGGMRLGDVRGIAYRATEARGATGLQLELDAMVNFSVDVPMNIAPGALTVEESVSVVWALAQATPAEVQ